MKISKQIFKKFLEKDVIHNDRVINFCLKQNSLTDAIKIAVLSRDTYNKKHKHQYRI